MSDQDVRAQGRHGPKPARVASYSVARSEKEIGQTVLTSFQQVEDNLVERRGQMNPSIAMDPIRSAFIFSKTGDFRKYPSPNICRKYP